MATTISSASETLTPLIVNGYASARASANIVHSIIGTTHPAVTLRPAGMRTGELELVVGTRALALEFEALLSSGEVLTLNDSSVDVAMSFVVIDSIEVALDDETRKTWMVTFSYQEVAS